METTEIIDLMAKGSPEAVVVMRPKDLKAFAVEAGRRAMAGTGPKWLPKRKSDIGLKGFAQAHLARDLMELFPKANACKLAEALGVSRQYLSKVLKLTAKAEAELAEGNPSLFAEAEYEAPASGLCGERSGMTEAGRRSGSEYGSAAEAKRRVPLEDIIQQLVDDRLGQILNEAKI